MPWLLCGQWRIQRVHCPGGGGTKSTRSAAGGGWGRGIPPPAGGGPGASPGKFLKNGCKWCILSPFFAEFVSNFSPKIVCNFCLQSSDLSIYVMRENFHLSCRRSYQAKEGEFFIFSQYGGSGSPRENFWKTDANGTFLAYFCRVRVDFFPKNCV